MTTRRIYPNPPIVEAIIEFRFAPSGGPRKLAEHLRRELAETYDASETRAQDHIEAQITVPSDGGVAAAAKRTPHLTFLQSASGHRLLGLGPGHLSVHTRAPYPGWESFLAQAKDAVAALPPNLADTPVTKVVVRYIDRIELPEAVDLAFSDYITVMPPRPPGMPEVLSGCYYATQASDPVDGTHARLTVASVGGAAAGRAALMFDVLLWRDGDPLCGFEVGSWEPIVEALHARQRDVFEQSITDRTRELFR